MKTVTFILIAGVIFSTASMANARGGGDGDCRECEAASYFPDEDTGSTVNEAKTEERGLSLLKCEMVDLEDGTGKKVCLDGRL